MTTAAQIIDSALKLYGIVDQTETAQPADISNGVTVLNDLLRNEMADGAAQFLIELVTVQLPAGINGQIYQFSVGTGSPGYLVQQDAVGVRSIWMNDVSLNVNRETRQGPKADVVRTTFPGIITKWHQERQSDGSVRITAWSPPRAPANALIEYGGRLPLISAPDGSDVVALPPEGIHDATLLYGRRVCASYGRSLQAVGIVATDADAVNKRWRDYAHGQQWTRFVRA